MKKKMFFSLLVVMLLFTVVSAFAEPIEKSGVLDKFLDETDLDKKDLALQNQYGDMVSDLVIHLDGDDLHLVRRYNDVAASHIQLDPNGIYLSSGDTVTLLRYGTVSTIMQDIVKAAESIVEEAAQEAAAQSDNGKDVLTEKEIKDAVDQMVAVAAAAERQQQADAATLSSAAMAFASHFKPEKILDADEAFGTVEITLRSEDLASAFADAFDEMMSNPALAEYVDRKAALEGGRTFAEIQAAWMMNREAYIKEIKAMESSETISEDGHYTSHFQIGEETAETKAMVCDIDARIDPEDNEAEFTVSMGLKDEDSIIKYEFAVDPDSYKEKMTAGDSRTEIQMDIEDDKVTDGTINAVVDGDEVLSAEFGQDYLYMKGPRGGISTTVRETWTGKLRYEVFAENVDGEETSITLDFYEEEDSLVCELNVDDSDKSALFKLSRIDKLDLEDLSASKNIDEITVDKVYAELENIMKMMLPANTVDAK